MIEHSIETSYGSRFDYDDPRPEQVSVFDIATSLAKTCRWRGFCDGYLSVAEHAVMVYHIVSERTLDPMLRYAALHHDSHEAYLGDVPTPLKHKMGELWSDIVRPVDVAIAERLGIHVDMFAHPIIKQADRTALEWEAAKVKKSGGAAWHTGWVRADLADVPSWAVQRWSPELAEKMFLLLHDKAASAAQV